MGEIKKKCHNVIYFTIFFIKLHNVHFEIWVFRICIFRNDTKLCYRILWSLSASRDGMPTIIIFYILMDHLWITIMRTWARRISTYNILYCNILLLLYIKLIQASGIQVPQTLCFLDFIVQQVGTGCPPSARFIYYILYTFRTRRWMNVSNKNILFNHIFFRTSHPSRRVLSLHIKSVYSVHNRSIYHRPQCFVRVYY